MMAEHTQKHETTDINQLFDNHNEIKPSSLSFRYTHDVLNALGGINKVVSDYIALTQSQHDTVHLDGTQINKLNEIITTTRTTVAEEEEDLDETKLVIYKFHTFNAGLYWLCESQERRDKTIQFIYNWVYNWITIAVACVCLTIYSFCWQFSDAFLTYDSIDGETGSDTFFAIGLILYTFANVWAFLLVLSLNRRAFIMLLKTFEFWVKVLYSISGSVFSFYIEYEPSKQHFNFLLQLLVRILFRTFFIYLVILMSSMDALPIDRKKQIALCSIATLAITLLAISSTADFYGSLLEEKSIFITSYIDIPTYTLRNSSYRIVALFFWKQTLWSYFRTEKCILIKYTPYVEWIHDEQHPESNEKQMDQALHAMKSMSETEATEDAVVNVEMVTSKEEQKHEED